MHSWKNLQPTGDEEGWDFNGWSGLAGPRHGNAGPCVTAEINGCSGRTRGSTTVSCPVLGSGSGVVQHRCRCPSSFSSSCATGVFLFFFLSTRGSPVSARIKRSPPFYGPQIFPFKTIPFFLFRRAYPRHFPTTVVWCCASLCIPFGRRGIGQDLGGVKY